MDLAVLSDNHQQRSQDNVFNGAKATLTAVRLNSKYQRSIPRISTRDLVCNIGRNHSRLVFDRRPEIVRITQLAVLTNGNQYVSVARSGYTNIHSKMCNYGDRYNCYDTKCKTSILKDLESKETRTPT